MNEKITQEDEDKALANNPVSLEAKWAFHDLVDQKAAVTVFEHLKAHDDKSLTKENYAESLHITRPLLYDQLAGLPRAGFMGRPRVEWELHKSMLTLYKYESSYLGEVLLVKPPPPRNIGPIDVAFSVFLRDRRASAAVAPTTGATSEAPKASYTPSRGLEASRWAPESLASAAKSNVPRGPAAAPAVPLPPRLSGKWSDIEGDEVDQELLRWFKATHIARKAAMEALASKEDEGPPPEASEKPASKAASPKVAKQPTLEAAPPTSPKKPAPQAALPVVTRQPPSGPTGPKATQERNPLRNASDIMGPNVSGLLKTDVLHAPWVLEEFWAKNVQPKIKQRGADFPLYGTQTIEGTASLPFGMIFPQDRDFDKCFDPEIRDLFIPLLRVVVVKSHTNSAVPFRRVLLRPVAGLRLDKPEGLKIMIDAWSVILAWDHRLVNEKVVSLANVYHQRAGNVINNHLNTIRHEKVRDSKVAGGQDANKGRTANKGQAATKEQSADGFQLVNKGNQKKT